MPADTQPLISVICFCKDRAAFIRRSVESVLTQSYRNLEFVVQDGASTDGTREILEEYARHDPRVKVVSEPDSGPAEAYWKVMNRCTGDYIATCLSDEELVPGALEKCVQWFANEPDLGAITCDGYVTDADGRIVDNFKAGDFDFVRYMFDTYCPFWPGSFFRRQALLDIGLKRPGWNIGSLEFEFWCRLATDHRVKYIPEPISKYAIHPGQLSNTPVNFNEHVENRLAMIVKLFSDRGFFGADEVGRILAMINHLLQFENHARAHHIPEEEAKFAAQIDVLRRKLRTIDSRYGSKSVFLTTQDQQTARYASYILKRIRRLIPNPIHRRISPKARSRVFRKLTSVLLAVRHMPSYSIWRLQFWVGRTPADRLPYIGPPLPSYVRFYPWFALLYDARGQTDEALAMWRRADVLNDSEVSALACQAMLKLPSATYESIAEFQQTWASRYANPQPAKLPVRFRTNDGTRPIRVGYHCSFMDSDTMRYIMRNAIKAHDRTKFEIYGYAATEVPDDIRSAFDKVTNTGYRDDGKFTDLVRRDGIDVFVELSGFSPGHRFGAMAMRCAPVQVSYLNHHGTSRVANVDYILSDAICTPSGSGAQQTFTEKIYNLPNCLLCYDYTDEPSPPVGEPPVLKRGLVTFGCFGSGGKINLELIRVWAELLRRVPNSKLMLQNGQLTSLDNRRYMADRFARFGIDADRLILCPGTDRLGLLKSYNDVDISLDTWPYCGGNTVAESLWQGVPVVTLLGSRFSSRYGASLVTAAGCADCVADDWDEYFHIAASLASDPQRLVGLRQNLRSMCVTHGLADSKRFARELEQAYCDMLSESRGVSSSAWRPLAIAAGASD